MRKFLINTIVLLLCSIAATAQTGQVKITLKNGTALTGTLIQLDAASSVMVKIGDISTTIPMSEVATLESVSGSNTDKKDAPASSDIGDEYGKYVVTDHKEYPDSFQVSIANQTFTMLLVRGGKFNMGYDDRKSRSMKSEPVHRVELSSFYVSKEYITVGIANRLLANEGDTLQTNNLSCRWRYAKPIVDSIAAKTATPYRMLTEAEWEYAAIQPEAERVFSGITSAANYEEKHYVGEWCADFFAKYSAKPQINSTGPTKGEKHVARTYRPDKDRWNLSCRWRYAKLIVDSIAAKTATPYRMLTEAEWEYAAIQPEAERVFSGITSAADYEEKHYVGEWCADFFAKYSAKPQINPTGPTKGEKHVARTYRPDKDIWNRDPSDNTDNGGHRDDYGYWVNDLALVRFAISANKLTTE